MHIMKRALGLCGKAVFCSGLLLLPVTLPSALASASVAGHGERLVAGAQSALKELNMQKDKALKDLDRSRKGMLTSMRSHLDRAREMCEERLLTKKEDIETINKDMLNRALNCMGEDESHGWEFVVCRKGITVHRKFMPAVNGVLSKFCCVRASGVLEASCEDVANLFEGNTRVGEYNKYFAEGRDLEYLNEQTKVVWACSPPLFLFKPRDYCTIVHYRKESDGTIIVLNHAAQHPAAPPSDNFVRAEVLMGASIIQPVRGEPNKCVFTTIAHINPGGMVPPLIVNTLCARGPVEFHTLVEQAAKRTKSMKKGLATGVDKYAATA